MMLTILISLLLLTACTQPAVQPAAGSFTVISYNAQTLFDGDETGSELSPFTRKEGWSKAKYQARIAALSELLKQQEYSSADVIFLEEIENSQVLVDLLSSGLRRRGFRYYGVLDNTSPITSGFISKQKPAGLRFHYTDSQRPVLECSFSHDGHYLTFLVLHAKSNSGDAEENRALRHEMARHLLAIVSSRSSEAIAILGDFNTEILRECGDLLASADAIVSGEIIASGSLPVTVQKPKASGCVFYDPFSDPAIDPGAEGTYYYDSTWYVYDRIMTSGALLEKISSLEPSIITASGDTDLIPWRYDASAGTGYSDHFAVKLRLVF